MKGGTEAARQRAESHHKRAEFGLPGPPFKISGWDRAGPVPGLVADGLGRAPGRNSRDWRFKVGAGIANSLMFGVPRRRCPGDARSAWANPQAARDFTQGCHGVRMTLPILQPRCRSGIMVHRRRILPDDLFSAEIAGYVYGRQNDNNDTADPCQAS
jgi:hypothetical protein